MPNEHARQKRLEKKRRKREERRQTAASLGSRSLEAPAPMSQILGQFADPWLDRLPDRDAVQAVLQAAAFVWNEAVTGQVIPETLDLVRGLFRRHGWAESAEDAARRLRERKPTLFLRERRLVMGVEVTREEEGLRVFALSAMRP